MAPDRAGAARRRRRHCAAARKTRPNENCAGEFAKRRTCAGDPVAVGDVRKLELGGRVQPDVFGEVFGYEGIEVDSAG